MAGITLEYIPCLRKAIALSCPLLWTPHWTLGHWVGWTRESCNFCVSRIHCDTKDRVLFWTSDFFIRQRGTLIHIPRVSQREREREREGQKKWPVKRIRCNLKWNTRTRLPDRPSLNWIGVRGGRGRIHWTLDESITRVQFWVESRTFTFTGMCTVSAHPSRTKYTVDREIRLAIINHIPVPGLLTQELLPTKRVTSEASPPPSPPVKGSDCFRPSIRLLWSKGSTMYSFLTWLAKSKSTSVETTSPFASCNGLVSATVFGSPASQIGSIFSPSAQGCPEPCTGPSVKAIHDWHLQRKVLRRRCWCSHLQFNSQVKNNFSSTLTQLSTDKWSVLAAGPVLSSTKDWQFFHF